MRRHDKRNKPRSAHVRHILVGHKPEAREILEQIANAKNPLRMFKKLAKKYNSKSVLWPLKNGSRFDLLRFGSVALEDREVWEVRGSVMQRFERFEVRNFTVPRISRLII